LDAFNQVDSAAAALGILNQYEVTAFCVIGHEGGTTGSARNQ
jgi:hypothetical protein